MAPKVKILPEKIILVRKHMKLYVSSKTVVKFSTGMFLNIFFLSSCVINILHSVNEKVEN